MIIECAYCEGTGHKYGRHDSTVCPVCDGNGKVNAPSENYTCDYCKGMDYLVKTIQINYATFL